ncbi:MAG: TlpA family protein disulfide reductase [Thermoanaerobaculia bacterium]
MTRTLVLVAALVAATSLSAAEIEELKNLDAVKSVVKSTHAPIRVVNLWATWCAPCVAEMPDLQKLSERFPRIALMGISLDDAIPGTGEETRARVARFLQDHRVKFRNFYFTGRQVELTDHFNFEGLPVTFVYDSDGKELTRVVGQLDYDSFAKKLASLEKTRKR